MPFKHESLLINDEETDKLTGSEKRAAKRGIYIVSLLKLYFITEDLDFRCSSTSTLRKLNEEFFSQKRFLNLGETN